MNGKIKTKFAALFAVALMITVCVVPVVGGSEDVEAATTETIDISGIVFKANGTTEWGGLEVYVDGTDIIATTSTIGSDVGSFTLEDVPVSNTIVVKVNIGEYLSDGTENPAAGYSFASITLTKATENVSGLKFVAGTVKISGTIKVGDDVIVPIESVEIKNGTKKVADTKADGSFEFIGTAGQIYELSTVIGGAEFKFNTNALTADKLDVVLITTDRLLYSDIIGPFGSISVDKSGTDAAISLSDEAFVKVGTGYKVLAKVTNSAASGTLQNVKITMNHSSGNQTYGLSPVTTSLAYGVANTNIEESLLAAGYTGGIHVGGVSIAPGNVTLKSTDTSQSSVSITAKVVGNEWFVGTKYGSGSSDVVAAGKVSIVAADKNGYKFTPLADGYGSDGFIANNAVKITVKADVPDTEFTVNANNAVVGAQGYVTSDLTGGVASFEFYVPSGTAVTVTAPANFETDKIYYSSVISNTETPVFTYIPDITYTGKVLLNGVALTGVSLKYTTNGEDATDSDWSDLPNTIWETDDQGIPYYSFEVSRTIDSSDILVKVGTSNYKFAVDDDNKAIPVGVTNGTTVFADYVVVSSKMTVVAKDGDLAIPGMEYTFYMLEGTVFDEDKIIKELGKAVTGSNGSATLDTAAAIPSSETTYSIYAVTDGVSDFGSYGKANIKVVSGSDATVAAFTGKTVYGFYTKDATEIPGLEISYIEKTTGSVLVGNGEAVIIGDKYYVVKKASTNTIELKVDTKKYTISGSNGNIEVTVINTPEYIVVTPIKNEYSAFAKVIIPENAVKGDVVVLSAEKTCYKLQNEMYGYKYSDAAVEYTFAGWYVNGKLLTEDCDASITLKENVVISAQYEEAIKVIASEEAPEAGLDTNVLILGIVVVVIALIAVVYSVISKRD